MTHAQPRGTTAPRDVAPAAVGESLLTGDGFEGTFLQLRLEHRGWSPDRWRGEFAGLRELGLDTLVVQWSALDEVSFVDDGGDGPGTMERVLTAAGEVGLDCYVGLSLRGSWGSAEPTVAYLGEELARNTREADRLAERLKGQRSFRGWYVPHEMSELLYTPEQWDGVLGFLAALSAHLNSLDPLRPVLASGYTDPSRSHPVRFALRWKEFLDRAGVDVLVLQDGAGIAREGHWRDVLPFVEAAAILDEGFPGDVWLLVEVFAQTGGSPLDEGPFRAEPADIGRVREQLEALAGYRKKLVAYSYFDYMRPAAGPAAQALHEGYRRLLRERVAEPVGSGR